MSLDAAATGSVHAFKRLRFHLEIDLRVHIRYLQRNVTQPCANSVDVNAATE
jgi:hypothetical protein